MLTRNELIEKLKQQLDTLNAQLDELEARAAQVSGEARSKAQQQINQLNELAQPLRTKLDELKTAGEAQLESLSGEADKVYKAFVHSFNYFKSQLK